MENENRPQRDKNQLNALCAQKEFKISLGILPVWSETLLCALWVAKDLNFLLMDGEEGSDFADAQAYNIFRWAHMSFEKMKPLYKASRTWTTG